MNKIEVLIASEEPIVREGLSHLLADEDDMEVVATAKDVQEAAQLVKELLPHIVIISVAEPILDDIEVAKEIKEACSTTRIIILSTYHHGSYVIPSLRAGAAGYLLRTSPLIELVNAIRSVHAGGEVLDPTAAGAILHDLATEKADMMGQIEQLHPREMEILKLVAKGMHNKDIASCLTISERTVQSHMVNIFRKLGVSSRTEAVLCALRKGWFTIENLD